MQKYLCFNLNKKENIWKIYEHFERKIERGEINKIDNKLWGIINPKIKNYLTILRSKRID